MSRPASPEPITRKTLAIPDTLWAEISEYRFAERIPTEAEAVRRLILAGLRAEARKREKG